MGEEDWTMRMKIGFMEALCTEYGRVFTRFIDLAISIKQAISGLFFKVNFIKIVKHHTDGKDQQQGLKMPLCPIVINIVETKGEKAIKTYFIIYSMFPVSL